jgi:hypothetical protein
VDEELHPLDESLEHPLARQERKWIEARITLERSRLARALKRQPFHVTLKTVRAAWEEERLCVARAFLANVQGAAAVSDAASRAAVDAQNHELLQRHAAAVSGVLHTVLMGLRCVGHSMGSNSASFKSCAYSCVPTRCVGAWPRLAYLSIVHRAAAASSYSRGSCSSCCIHPRLQVPGVPCGSPCAITQFCRAHELEWQAVKDNLRLCEEVAHHGLARHGNDEKPHSKCTEGCSGCRPAAVIIVDACTHELPVGLVRFINLMSRAPP